MDVRSLYTNVPQEEGIETVCKTYDAFYQEETPIPTEYLKTAKYRFAKYHFAKYHFAKYHFVSFRFVSFRKVP